MPEQAARKAFLSNINFMVVQARTPASILLCLETPISAIKSLTKEIIEGQDTKFQTNRDKGMKRAAIILDRLEQAATMTMAS